MLTIFTPTGTQSRLTVYHLLCRKSCSAENACTLASLGISLPGQGTAHRAKGQEIKRLPKALELNLLRSSFFSLQLKPLDSQGLFYFMPFDYFADFLQCIGRTSRSPGVLRAPINWHLMGRWCRWPGSNVRPEQVAEKGERKQLQGKEQAGLVFVPLRISKCRERLEATNFFKCENKIICLKRRIQWARASMQKQPAWLKKEFSEISRSCWSRWLVFEVWLGENNFLSMCLLVP